MAPPPLQVLLRHHARCNQPDDSGITPFVSAVRSGNAQILAELCRAPSAALGLNAPSSSTGLTAMHEAAGQAGAQLLIEIMADAGGEQAGTGCGPHLLLELLCSMQER